jgi:integrase/recombinase XerD
MKFNPRRRTLQVKRVEPSLDLRSRLEGFLRYIAHEVQLADNSVAAYRRDMEHFFQWLGNRSIERLRIDDYADYVAWLAKRPGKKELAPSSRARHIASLRTFFRYLQLEGVMPDNPAKLLGSPKLWERMTKILSPGQVAELLVAPVETSDKLWRRDRAILEFFYATGCRCSELVNLKLRDIHEAEGYCDCIGKGNKPRFVPLTSSARTAFRSWIKNERETVLDRRREDHRPYFSMSGKNAEESKVPWAFLSFKGYKMRREAMWNLIKKYADRIGAPPDTSPHTLRHSFATHRLAEGVDLRVIQEILGHESIMTTQIYTHPGMERLKKVHSECHPRG